MVWPHSGVDAVSETAETVPSCRSGRAVEVLGSNATAPLPNATLRRWTGSVVGLQTVTLRRRDCTAHPRDVGHVMEEVDDWMERSDAPVTMDCAALPAFSRRRHSDCASTHYHRHGSDAPQHGASKDSSHSLGSCPASTSLPPALHTSPTPYSSSSSPPLLSAEPLQSPLSLLPDPPPSPSPPPCVNSIVRPRAPRLTSSAFTAAFATAVPVSTAVRGRWRAS